MRLTKAGREIIHIFFRCGILGAHDLLVTRGRIAPPIEDICGGVRRRWSARRFRLRKQCSNSRSSTGCLRAPTKSTG